MSELDIYVYECTVCEGREKFVSGSVAPPEAHLFGQERVYCEACGEDQMMEFLGLNGFTDDRDNFVLDGETRERYCPLCDGACEK